MTDKTTIITNDEVHVPDCPCCRWRADPDKESAMADKPTTMPYDEVHAILDKARSGDTITVVRTNGGDLASTVSGPVLGDPHLSQTVGIDMLDGGPYIVRDRNGTIWGQFLRVELEKGEPR